MSVLSCAFLFSGLRRACVRYVVIGLTSPVVEVGS